MTLVGHTAFINRAVCVGPLLLSTSFDGTVRIWTLTERLTMIHHLKNESGSLETEDGEEECEGDQDEILSKWKKRTSGNLVHRQTIRTNFGGCLHILKVWAIKMKQIAAQQQRALA